MDWSEWFYYDETSVSCLRWKVDVRSGTNYSICKVKAGDRAGAKDTHGHWQVKLRGKYRRIHTIIWELHNGPIPDGMIVEHFDRNPSNNTVSNFRLATHSINMRNRKISKSNKSGVNGVVRTKSNSGSWRWSAIWVTLDKKQHSKTYACNKYGEELAFQMACDYRNKMIEELNAQGAGYTEDHGK